MGAAGRSFVERDHDVEKLAGRLADAVIASTSHVAGS
jgi:hypothetical protein